MVTSATASISLTGRQGQISWPDICPHCGKPAATPLKVAKVFTRRRRSGRGWQSISVATAFEALFCQSCAHQHHREIPAISMRQWLEFGFKAAVYGIPGAIAFSLGVEVGMRIVGYLKRGDEIGFLLIMPFVLFFLGMGLWFLRKGWLLGYPALVRPQTSITQSFDFTDDLSQDFEPTWRHFTFTQPDYAYAFRQMNEHLIWRTDGKQAKRAKGMRTVRNVLVIGLIAAILIIGWLSRKYPHVVEQLWGR